MIPRSILITGCSSGIGLCCATGLQARGWRVLATARRPVDLDMLKSAGLEPISLELSDPASVTACANRALELTGGMLTALFNNAAFGQPGAVEDLPVEVLKQQFEVNLFSWHALTRAIIPAMRANAGGRIVQCSSVLGFVSPPYRGAYNASKHALEALSDAMHFELAGTGIRISVIEPGPIASRFVDRALVALRDNIDLERSPHAVKYKSRLASMSAGGKQTFKLGPEAVLAKLIHAVESPRPRRRYRVTYPTHIAALAKRLLPGFLADKLVARI